MSGEVGVHSSVIGANTLGTLVREAKYATPMQAAPRLEGRNRLAIFMTKSAAQLRMRNKSLNSELVEAKPDYACD